MKIGTMRPEEAKVFDGSAGEHRINDVIVTVYWEEGKINDLTAGWYWHATANGGGPFSTSFRALTDAEETLG